MDKNERGISGRRIDTPILDLTAGSRQLTDRVQGNQGTDPMLSGGDIDVRWEDAESSED